jgi:hypothetical protein
MRRKGRMTGIRVRMRDWSPKLREEHRLGVFENRVLRRIF